MTETTQEHPADERLRTGEAVSRGITAPAAHLSTTTPQARARLIEPHPDGAGGWQYLRVEAEWAHDLDEAVVLPVSVVIWQTLEEYGREDWEVAGVVAEPRKRTYILRRLRSS